MGTSKLYKNVYMYIFNQHWKADWKGGWHFWDGRQAGDRTTFFNTRIKKVIRNQFMHLIIINYGWPEQLCSTCSIIHYILIGNRWTTELTTLAISYSQRPKVDYYFFNKLSFHRSFKNNFLNKHETDNYFKDCCCT